MNVPTTIDLKYERLKVLSEILFRVNKQVKHGRIKTVEGCLRMFSDQIFIYQSEITNQP